MHCIPLTPVAELHMHSAINSELVDFLVVMTMLTLGTPPVQHHVCWLNTHCSGQWSVRVHGQQSWPSVHTRWVWEIVYTYVHVNTCSMCGCTCTCTYMYRMDMHINYTSKSVDMLNPLTAGDFSMHSTCTSACTYMDVHVPVPMHCAYKATT